MEQEVEYISTFATGLSEPVAVLLKERLENGLILGLWDGLIRYRTTSKPVYLRKLSFLNNTFQLLNLRKDCKNINEYATYVAKQITNLIPNNPFDSRNTFRVLNFDRNTPFALSRNMLETIELGIVRKTKLSVNRQKSDFEFCIHFREEGFGFFSLRLAKRQSDKTRERGELRKEIANILVLLSQPQANEIFLDPYSGSGAIPFARANQLPKCVILASDNNENAVASLKEKVKRLKLKDQIIVRKLDANNLEKYQSDSINKIVTDPPWGNYENIENPISFYKNMLSEFVRILSPQGRIVLLVANNDNFLQALSSCGDKVIELANYATLIGGRKARIFVLEKAHKYESLSN